MTRPGSVEPQRRLPARRLAVAARVFVLVLVGIGSAHAAERELEKEAPGGSVREIESPIQRVFPRIASREPIFKEFSKQLEELPPFFAGTDVGVRYATFYKRDDRANGDLAEAWVMGGSIYYRSGWLADLFQVELEGFTSQPVVAQQDRGGTLLLEDRQNGYTELGIASARLQRHGYRLTGFRQYLDLPYLNRRLNRLTPNTFESLTFEKFEGPIQFSVGHTWRIKERNSDEFVSMARAAGVPKDRGLTHAGLLWVPNDDFQAGVIAGHVRDLETALYSETNLTHRLNDDVELRLDTQFTYQWEDGKDLLGSALNDAWNVGVRGGIGYRGVVLRLAYAQTGSNAPVRSAYGTPPSYVDLQKQGFNRADEKVVLVTLSTDFGPLGAKGLRTVLFFAAGFEGEEGPAQGDRQEFNAIVDYRLGAGPFQDLWLRFRGAWAHDDVIDRDGADFQLILRYEFPLI